MKANIPYETLYDLYIVQQKTSKEIADLFKISQPTALSYLRKNNIDIRPNTLQIQNQKFGRLFVKSFKELKSKKSYWNCICDCGNEVVVSGPHLISNSIKSCGCLRNDRIKETCYTGYKEITGTFWRRIITNAKARNIEFDIDKEYCWSILENQNNQCFLSGLDLVFDKNPLIQTASLDRIDTNIGYIKNNIQWLHKDINISKNILDDKTYIKYCNLVSNPITGTKYQINNLYCQLWSSLLSGAKKRNIEINIDKNYLIDLFNKQGGLCNLTGLQLTLPTNSKDFKLKYTSSLDRINNNLGYIKGNLQYVHRTINMMKYSYTQDYFIELCTTVTKWSC